jgi:hypothetical protein
MNAAAFQKKRRRPEGNAGIWIRKPAGKGRFARFIYRLSGWLALRPYSTARVKENYVAPAPWALHGRSSHAKPSLSAADALGSLPRGRPLLI